MKNNVVLFEWENRTLVTLTMFNIQIGALGLGNYFGKNPEV